MSGSYAMASVDGQTLFGDVPQISITTGGTQNLFLDAGAGLAGQFYLILGSTSGTDPGLTVGQAELPLNPDPYFFLLLNNPGQPPLLGSLGFLDPLGQGGAQLVLPPGLNPTLAGLELQHAALTLDTNGDGSPIFGSNAEPLQLVP